MGFSDLRGGGSYRVTGKYLTSFQRFQHTLLQIKQDQNQNKETSPRKLASNDQHRSPDKNVNQPLIITLDIITHLYTSKDIWQAESISFFLSLLFPFSPPWKPANLPFYVSLFSAFFFLSFLQQHLPGKTVSKLCCASSPAEPSCMVWKYKVLWEVPHFLVYPLTHTFSFSPPPGSL